MKKYLILCKMKKNIATYQQSREATPHRLTRFTCLPLNFIYILNYGHWIMKCVKEISNSVGNVIADVRPIELHKER